MTVMSFLVKKFPGEKGSVRQCIVEMQQPQFGAVFAHYHAVAVELHSSMRN
jgi:hypothetical protein